jgi:hypothetical protein
MNNLVQLMVATLNHFGSELSLEDCFVDDDKSEEWNEEVQKLIRELRHDLGSANIKARRLNHLIRYGEDEN